MKMGSFAIFVEYRIGSSTAAGSLLFFASVAASVPVWGQLAKVYGIKTVLLWGMGLSIVAFMAASFVGQDDITFFVVICVASGAALGEYMTLLRHFSLNVWHCKMYHRAKHLACGIFALNSH